MGHRKRWGSRAGRWERYLCVWPGTVCSCLSQFVLFLSLTIKRNQNETGGEQTGGRERQEGE